MSIPGMDQLSQRDQMQVVQALNEMQMQDMMNMYNTLVERCFNECVTSFRTKGLEGHEEQCVTRCVQKFMSFSQRVSLRFQEKQQQMQLQKPA
ncbi:unnamed protein product [Effrenium voratum]|uniref:Mitochondrial import inner membrane translocase subunit n=1 Tax=Effrenium voratum TaxID=2562239 RepID=A0AA36HPN8_9DINO|nr:unnamed protein product [Effrenium voratum]CAJ1372382.1 unnamed protein product [Effrenium voratum]CAJ1423274.1 unnamed protein product [Effrenium voratum]CAJ1447739.1 unnamed protein product [Effrenium voratum]